MRCKNCELDTERFHDNAEQCRFALIGQVERLKSLLVRDRRKGRHHLEQMEADSDLLRRLVIQQRIKPYNSG